MFNISLLIFLFLSPILYLPLSVPALATLQWYQFGFFTNNVEVVQRQIFMYGIFLLMVTGLFDIPNRIFGDNYLKYVLLVCFFNVWAHPITIKIIPTVFLGFLLYYLVSVSADVKNLKSFFITISLVSFLNTLFAIIQFFHVPCGISKPYGEIIGLMDYKTQLGIYQALAMPICFSLNPWTSIIPMIGLLLSNSATAMSAGALGMMYFLWKKGLRIKSIPFWQIFFVISVGCIYLHWNKAEIRFFIWCEAFKEGFSHWFHGNGIGLFNYVRTYYLHGVQPWPVTYTDPYSIYLEVFYSLGVFGLIAFLFFLGERFFNFTADGDMELALYTSCFILFFVGFFYSFMDYPRMAGTAIILFGLLTAVKREKRVWF